MREYNLINETLSADKISGKKVKIMGFNSESDSFEFIGIANTTPENGLAEFVHIIDMRSSYQTPKLQLLPEYVELLDFKSGEGFDLSLTIPYQIKTNIETGLPI